MRLPSRRKFRLGVVLLVLAPAVWFGTTIAGNLQQWFFRCSQGFRLWDPARDAARLPAAFEKAKQSDHAKATALDEAVELKQETTPGEFRLTVHSATSGVRIERHFYALEISMNHELRLGFTGGPAPLVETQQFTVESYGPDVPIATFGAVLAGLFFISGLWLVIENRARPVLESDSGGRYVPPPPPESKPPPPPGDRPSTYDY